MSKKRLAALAVCACFCGAWAVAAEKIDFDQGVEVTPFVPKIAKGAFSDKGGLAQWTVMVYVNAKNNLEEYGLKNVKQMEEVGSTNEVKIAVELGRTAQYSHSDGGWKGERRYIIHKDRFKFLHPHKIISPYEEVPKSDMGNWNHLVDFVKWAQKTAPAEHYMLIVWNHGSGWLKQQHAGGKRNGQDNPDNGEMVTNGISYDEEFGTHINTVDLGHALAAIGKLDIYASDACLMQMIEVDYQLKDFADYFVQSEEVEPADGYTYNTLLAPLTAQPSMTASDLARLAVKSYADHYAKTGKGATQSAVQASSLPKLTALLNEWTQEILNDRENEAEAVKSARSEAQHFYIGDNKDLLDFVAHVDTKTPNETVRGIGKQLEDHISGEVVLKNGPTGDGYANAFGLAVYLPDKGYDKNYNQLAWAGKNAGENWKNFIRWAKDL